QDPLANWNGIVFTYNAIYPNLGGWANFLPGHLTPNQHLTPEPLIASGALYVWACFGGVVICNQVMQAARRRSPRLGTLGLMAVGLFWGPHGGTFPTDITKRSYFMYGVCGPGTDYMCPGPDVPLPKMNGLHVNPEGQLVGPKGAPRSRDENPNLGSLRGSLSN